MVIMKRIACQGILKQIFFSAKIDFDYIPAPSHLIKFGGEFVNHLYRPEVERSRSLNNLDGKEEKSDKVNDASPNLYGNELSAYIEDDMTCGEHFSFNPGLYPSLFLVNGRTYFCPEARAAVKVSFGKGWAVKTAYSKMSQYVHQLTSGNLSLPTDLWVPIAKNIRTVT